MARLAPWSASGRPVCPGSRLRDKPADPTPMGWRGWGTSCSALSEKQGGRRTSCPHAQIADIVSAEGTPEPPLCLKDGSLKPPTRDDPGAGRPEARGRGDIPGEVILVRLWAFRGANAH